MKIPASKVPAQVWADKAMRRADLDEVESMLLSSWNDSKQVYRIGKELWDELRIDEADEVPVDALLRLPYGCTTSSSSCGARCPRGSTSWAWIPLCAALKARRRRWRSSYRRCGIASSTCPSAGRCATATRIRKVY